MHRIWSTTEALDPYHIMTQTQCHAPLTGQQGDLVALGVGGDAKLYIFSPLLSDLGADLWD